MRGTGIGNVKGVNDRTEVGAEETHAAATMKGIASSQEDCRIGARWGGTSWVGKGGAAGGGGGGYVRTRGRGGACANVVVGTRSSGWVPGAEGQWGRQVMDQSVVNRSAWVSGRKGQEAAAGASSSQPAAGDERRLAALPGRCPEPAAAAASSCSTTPARRCRPCGGEVMSRRKSPEQEEEVARHRGLARSCSARKLALLARSASCTARGQSSGQVGGARRPAAGRAASCSGGDRTQRPSPPHTHPPTPHPPPQQHSRHHTHAPGATASRG